MSDITTIAPWPIVSKYPLEIDTSALKNIIRLTDSLRSDEPALADGEPCGPGVRCGWQATPCLYFEDHRSIQLQPSEQARYFEYRSFALSSTNDIYLRSTGRVLNFEQYTREHLGCGAETVLTVDVQKAETRSLAKACLANEDHVDYLASRARVAGGLNISPFIVTEDVWILASELHRRSACPITIIGPNARLATRANDKLWFTVMARAVLGREHLPVTCHAYTLGAAVAELKFLAHQSPRVVLKTRSSAGSCGNFIFDSREVEAQTESDFRRTVEQRLESAGWHDDFPLLTATWEAPVHSSPSAQVWIPSSAHGLPIIEGLFTQSLAGRNVGFTGALPASLPLQLQEQMVREAGLLASCLQQLGYFGRASFDAILLGEHAETAELHWIECNARWGGVSIPMTCAHKIAADQGLAVPATMVLQKPYRLVSVKGFDTYINSLGSDVLDKDSYAEGIVCLTPVGEPDTTAALLIMACNQTSVMRLADKASLALGLNQG